MSDIEAQAREFPGSVKRKLEFEDRERVVMHLWRTSELPEFFLGNKGTNKRLVAFADAVAREAREAALKDAMKEAQLYGSERNMDWNDNVLPDENWHKRDAAYAVRDRIEAMLEFPNDQRRTRQTRTCKAD